MMKIGLKQLVMYAGASGDFNPIHYDFEVARNSGFQKPIVHGMLSMALCIGQVISEHNIAPGKIKKVKARFKNPVMMEEGISFKIEKVEENKFIVYLLKEDGNVGCECEVEIEKNG